MKSLALTVSCALLLVACERPVAPTPRHSVVGGRAAFAAAGVLDRVAYRYCNYDWDWETFSCLLEVANGDGTVSSFGDATTTYNEPSWSPDGTQVAVDNQSDIFVVNLADGSAANLTNGAGQNYSAAWSTDGARIAFVSNRDGQPELYLMNASNGSNVTRVTNGVGFRGDPSWFPDGTRLVFDCQIESGNGDICAINVDGTGLVRLTNAPGPDWEADVSPDGTRIAFSTGRYASAPTNSGIMAASGASSGQWSTDIAVMDASGANVTRLTTIGNAGQPDWSPGGGRIAFTKLFNAPCDGYCESEFYIMNADGSSQLRMDYGQQPAWRPAAGDATPPPDQPPVARIETSCRDDRCYLSGIPSTDDYEVTAYVWDFGDGSPASHEWSLEHTYAVAGTHVVTLTVFDGAGQSSTATTSVTTTPKPDLPPQARFGFTCVVSTCSFKDASVDDHGIVSRAWTFGDGSSAGDVAAPSHTYAAGGTYNVTLTVTDGAGQTNSVTYSVRPLNRAPEAHFTYSCVNSKCTFDASTSSDEVGLVYYTWDLGNGAGGSSTLPLMTVEFVGVSSLSVTLTVLDRVGQKGSVTQTVIVK
jgi:PKD repeat protein